MNTSIVNESDKPKKYGTYEDLHKIYGFPKGTLYSMVCRKEIPHIRLARRHVLFDLDEVQTWLNKHAVPASNDTIFESHLKKFLETKNEAK